MSQSNISAWLQFALQQMAAESYLDQLASGRQLKDILTDGNNDIRVIPPELFSGKTRFTDQLVSYFVPPPGSSVRYHIIDHHANDASGFSATLMFDPQNNSYTLSFRSTEPRPALEGGDVERDGLFASGLTPAADGEIGLSGFAFGQLIAMERYYLELTTSGKLPVGATLNVTGFSLGGHLATVFTELHASQVAQTTVFNASGRGRIDGFSGTDAVTLSAEAQQIDAMLFRFMTILFDPQAGVTRPSDEEMVAFQFAREAQLANPTWNPFTSGSTENLYVDPRYRWAKQVTLTEFDTVGTAELEVRTGLSGIQVTEGAFSKITQIFGDAAFGDDTLVALSGLSAGPIQSVLIEGQPLLPGTIIPRLSDAGSSHSITLIVDSLAVQELIRTVDPAYRQAGAELLIRAASNTRAIDTLTQERAEGDSLEKTVDVFRKLFLGPTLPAPNPLNVDFAVGGFANFTFRNEMYTAMAAIQDLVMAKQADGVVFTIDDFSRPSATNVPEITAEHLAGTADTETDQGLAYRYALKQLNPFAVIASTAEANDALYAAHNGQGQLDRFNPEDGVGSLTAQYLADRAQFLVEKIALNLDDQEVSTGTIRYEDRAQEYTIGTDSVFAADRQFLFGSDASEPDLIGGSGEDHLYGGAGSDYLDGQAGRDYLEGNGGTDILLGGVGRDILLGQQGLDHLEGGEDDDRLAGGLDTDELLGGAGLDVYYLESGGGHDTITDSDGLGLIQVDQRLLVGGIHKPDDAANTYTSLDGRFRYVRAGSTLTIANQQSAGDQIIIENYSPGQLGIRLVDVSAVVAQENGLSVRTNDSFPFGEIDETSNSLTLEGFYNYSIDVLSGNDSVVGGFGNDSISGSGGIDTLLGMDGTDFLYGGSEDDTLSGGDDADSIHGDGGNDRLSGGDGGDWLLGGDGDDDLDGGDGNDFLDAEGGTGYHRLSGGVGNDVVVGGGGKDILYGDERDGSRISEGGADLLYGGGGDDGGVGEYGLQGMAGADILIGGDGNDKLLGDGFNTPEEFWDAAFDGQDWIDGGGGDDVIVGGGHDDILVGGFGNDRLYGDYEQVFLELRGNDLLDGGDGDDLLIGGMGNDTLYGGTGDDVLRGDNQSPSDSSNDGGDDVLDGGEGNDDLAGGLGNDLLLGGLGNDRLDGGAGNDELDGGRGHDQLEGGAGFDTIHGGSGNDRLEAGFRTSGSAGGSQAFSFAAFSSEPVSAGSELLLVSEPIGTDQLFGDAGDDYLISGDESLNTDDSLLVGGSGDDTYEVDSLGDVLVEAAGDGTDSVISYLNAYTLLDHFENLSFRGLATMGVGNSLDNVMSGARSLEGLEGNDTLNGVGRLDGGVGDDLLQGRSGLSFFSDDTGQLEFLANTFVFRPGDGRDTIQENDALFNSAYYQNEDKVVFADGVASSDVTWERAGNDLVLHVGHGTDQVTVASFYDLRLDRGGYRLTGAYVPPEGLVFTVGEGVSAYVAPSRVELVEFADGTVWNADRFGAPLLGDVRAETYRFGRGSGEVTVLDLDVTQSNIDREQDRILIGAGVLPSEVTLTRTNGDDLVLSINGTNDRLTVQSFFKTITVIPPFTSSGYSVAAYRIEQVQFTDGTVWTVSDLFNRLSIFVGTAGADTLIGNPLDNLIQGLSGDDYLSGQGGNDRLDGGAGNDRLFGDAGNDTYLFGRGNGQDILVSRDDAGTDTDVVLLGADVLPSDVTVQVVGASNDLVVRINGTTDQLLLDEFLWRADLQIDQLVFGDGTVWDAAMILDHALGLTLTGTEGDNTLRGSVLDDALIGLDGNDLLVGNEGDDRLLGGLGNDELSGDAGADTYVFNMGDGIDTIYDEDLPGEANRIVLGPGIGQGDLSFVRDEAARTLIIQVGSGSDRLVLENFDPTGFDGSLVVSVLEFADGSALALADLFPLNQAPTVAHALVDQIVPEGAPVSFVVPADTFADVDAGDVLTYSASLANGSALPAWLSFDVNTRTFTGMPDDAQVGSLDLRVTATDTGTLTASDVFTLTVTNVNEAPTVSAPLSDQQATEDTPFSLVVPASTFADVDAGDSLAYSATLAGGVALPAWLSFNPVTRTLSGTPLNGDVDSLSIDVTAADLGGLSATDTFALTVQNVNDAPTVATPIADQSTNTGAAFTFIVAANTFADVDAGDTLTYSATLANGSPLPNWLTFNSATRTFSGTPGASQAGLVNLKVTATDSGNLSAFDFFDLTVTSQDQILTGTSGNDVLTGGVGNDQLFGLAGNDTLNGGTGNDLLDGGTGTDTMVGGTGNDTYVVDNVGDVVTENLNEGIDTVQSSITYTLGAGVENLTLTGTTAINGTGNALDNTLTGNGAINVLTGGAGNDTYVVSAGDSVSESVNGGTDTVLSAVTWTLATNVEHLTLTGSAHVNGTGNVLNNTLMGNNGNNVLDGGAGNDLLDGGTGNDSLLGGSGDDQLIGGLGTDVLNAGSGQDVLNGGEGADTLDGGAGDDQLLGGAGNDTLTGGSGADQFMGGSGNDQLTGNSGNDVYTFSRGDGQDVIIDSDPFPSNQDRTVFGDSINPLDLVISRQANDLRLSIHGSTDLVTIKDWYTSPTTNQVESIQAGNGQALLSSQVDQLIQAMASFSQQTGLTWDQAIDQRPQEVQAVLAASWQ